MNKLSKQEQVRVIQALVEGCSINSTVRMTGIAKTTILRLIAQFGEACWQFHNEQVQNLQTERVQCDELWAFCHCKARNVKFAKSKAHGIGDVWTWTAIDADSKLMITWMIGDRNGPHANAFVTDMGWRLANRVQLTSDGHHTYMGAIWNEFEENIDYAQINKRYQQTQVAPGRYSPPICIGATLKPMIGNPDEKHISTSFVERSNLTVRMSTRRYTRLTNGHSKKFDNHVAMTTIFLTYYNWCRIHQTLDVTPAMEAGLTTKLWEIEDLLGILDAK